MDDLLVIILTYFLKVTFTSSSQKLRVKSLELFYFLRLTHT